MVEPSELSLMQALPIDGILESLRIGVGFLWTAAWAIIMGLVITSLVQVYVSKERMASVLGEGPRRPHESDGVRRGEQRL